MNLDLQLRRSKEMDRKQRQLSSMFLGSRHKGIAVLAVLVVVLLFASSAASRNNDIQATRAALTDDELESILSNIKGHDNRLFRWSASEETEESRRQGGCDKLPDACSVLMDQSKSSKSKSLAALFLTFCLTDSPKQRTRFSAQEGVHKAVVDLVSSKDPVASAAASHLIYISSFSNEKNHQIFSSNGAVKALSKIIMNDKAVKSQIMWAAAALQNLEASYCDTKNNGRCYWKWTRDEPNIVLKTPPVVSDGSTVRKEILMIDGLIAKLIALACTGPVRGKPSDNNIFPGENAIFGRDDDNSHLVAWAAAGALKNMALEPSAKLKLEPALVCMCSLADSPDWLESAKSSDFLSFMRRGGDPCWFRKQGSELCIDANFLDSEGYHCGDYGENSTREECQAKDVKSGLLAKKACCGCGGGTVYQTAIHEDL